MRVVVGAIAFAFAISFAGSAGALSPPTNATAVQVTPSTNATIVAQRCRCVEKRWNGSCKLQVCK